MQKIDSEAKKSYSHDKGYHYYFYFCAQNWHNFAIIGFEIFENQVKSFDNLNDIPVIERSLFIFAKVDTSLFDTEIQWLPKLQKYIT